MNVILFWWILHLLTWWFGVTSNAMEIAWIKQNRSAHAVIYFKIVALQIENLLKEYLAAQPMKSLTQKFSLETSFENVSAIQS